MLRVNCVGVQYSVCASMCSACVDTFELSENYKEQDLLMQTEQHLVVWFEKNRGDEGPAHMQENQALLCKTREELLQLRQKAARLEAERENAECTGYGFMVTLCTEPA